MTCTSVCHAIIFALFFVWGWKHQLRCSRCWRFCRHRGLLISGWRRSWERNGLDGVRLVQCLDCTGSKYPHLLSSLLPNSYSRITFGSEVSCDASFSITYCCFQSLKFTSAALITASHWAKLLFFRHQFQINQNCHWEKRVCFVLIYL